MGLSQEAFADKVGTSRRHVMRLERGDHKPTAVLLKRIADATGVHVDELLGTDDEDDEEASSRMTLDDFLLMRVRQIMRDERGAAVLR